MEVPADNAADKVEHEVAQVWDVFVSHASEDKQTTALPLAIALRELKVSVWLDDFELKIGDSLRRKLRGSVTAGQRHHQLTGLAGSIMDWHTAVLAS